METRKVYYVLTVYREPGTEGTARWYGCLRAQAGQLFPFANLAELNRLLCEVAGWVEPRGRD